MLVEQFIRKQISNQCHQHKFFFLDLEFDMRNMKTTNFQRSLKNVVQKLQLQILTKSRVGVDRTYQTLRPPSRAISVQLKIRKPL